MRELDFIQDVPAEASEYVKEKYADRLHLEVSAKDEATNLLTEADIEVQQRVVKRIAAEFPSDVVVAEEMGMDRDPKDPDCRCWVLDPIDGTQNFVRGVCPAFGVSLAFAAGGEPVAGGVSLPVLGDLLIAEQGAGAFRNGERIEVSGERDLDRARIEIDFVRLSKRQRTLDSAAHVMRRAGQIRSHGAAVVAFAAVAAGEAEAFIHVGLQPWDYGASKLIVEEAGGKTSRLDGSPLALFGGKTGVLASNGVLHEELLGLLDVD